MKSLTIYLPKDISNIILDYLYKPDITKLNKEYHDNYMVNEDYNRHRVKHICGFSYNYRPLNKLTEECYIANIKEYQTFNMIFIFLPVNYAYSSGCSKLNKYQNEK